jgi:hypothetical protein
MKHEVAYHKYLYSLRITIQNVLNKITVPWDVMMISAMKMEKADSSKTLNAIYKTALRIS